MTGVLGRQWWRIWDARNIEEMNSEECDNEPKEEGDGVHPIGGIEPLEKNKRGDNDCRREADVVHRVDTRTLRQQEKIGIGDFYIHICGENSQRLVEVIHLHKNANSDHNAKDVSTWVRELVVSSEGELEGNAKAINSHDGNRPDQGTYRDVHDGGRLSIARRNVVDHDKREHEDGKAVQEKACGQ